MANVACLSIKSILLKSFFPMKKNSEHEISIVNEYNVYNDMYLTLVVFRNAEFKNKYILN